MSLLSALSKKGVGTGCKMCEVSDRKVLFHIQINENVSLIMNNWNSKIDPLHHIFWRVLGCHDLL